MILDILMILFFVTYGIWYVQDIIRCHRAIRAIRFSTAFIPFVYEAERCKAKQVIAVVETLIKMRLKKDPLYGKANHMFQERMDLTYDEMQVLWQDFDDEIKKLLFP